MARTIIILPAKTMMLKNRLQKVNLYSQVLMVLTSVHHIYGAYAYNTPWRLHVLFLSIPIIIITTLLKNYLVNKEKLKKNIAIWVYWLIVLIASVVLIGSYEGIYNHLLKNLLFFSGLDNKTLTILFPPSTYEMPNNFFFEFTGVLQAIIAIILWVWFVRLTKSVSEK